MHLDIYSINLFLLLLLIIISLYFDLTKKRIPNLLTFSAMLWGLISFTVVDGLNGLWFSFSGLLVGLAIFFIPFALGWMGAGDVKLLGAIGALQGWQFVLSVALLTALTGGVMALIYLLASGRLLRVLKQGVGFLLAPFFSFLYYRIRLNIFNRVSIYFATHNPEEQEPARMPYGLAIAAGIFIFVMMNYFNWGERYLNAFPW